MPVLFSQRSKRLAHSYMQSHPNHNPIRIFWEHLQEPDSAQLVRQAVELILAEIKRDPTAEAFDKLATPGHAEDAPVESNNQSTPTTL